MEEHVGHDDRLNMFEHWWHELCEIATPPGAVVLIIGVGLTALWMWTRRHRRNGK